MQRILFTLLLCLNFHITIGNKQVNLDEFYFDAAIEVYEVHLLYSKASELHAQVQTGHHPANVKAFLTYQRILYALKTEHKYGVPFRLALAQCILETGWGRSISGNNYYGIKGRGNVVPTLEYVKERKRMVPVMDSFRAYNSFVESLEDYCSLLTRLYMPENPHQLACWYTSLSNVGYATDPNYIYKLDNIITKYLT